MTTTQERNVRYSMIVERFNKLLNAGIDVTSYTADYLREVAPTANCRELEEHMVNIAHNMDILEWNYCEIEDEHIKLKH
jgi:hypothetical protein